MQISWHVFLDLFGGLFNNFELYLDISLYIVDEINLNVLIITSVTKGQAKAKILD